LQLIVLKQQQQQLG